MTVSSMRSLLQLQEQFWEQGSSQGKPQHHHLPMLLPPPWSQKSWWCSWCNVFEIEGSNCSWLPSTTIPSGKRKVELGLQWNGDTWSGYARVKEHLDPGFALLTPENLPIFGLKINRNKLALQLWCTTISNSIGFKKWKGLNVHHTKNWYILGICAQQL